MTTPSQTEGPRFTPNLSRRRILLMLAVLASGIFLSLSPIDRLANADGTDFCQLTSQHALRSCRKEARSDYFLALGKCDNVADADTREDCEEEAVAERKDALETCSAQFDARQAACERLGPAPYDPVINPSNFVSTIDNPYFPLKPGTTYFYRGNTAEGVETNTVAVTHNTKVILGVTCVEVRDKVFLDGELTEDTRDWYAQDIHGNVWYFGENSRELEGPLTVSIEGSWIAGEDGAKPGIIMKAHPAVGDFYRQEFSLGTAEDLGEVLSLNRSVTVPAGSFAHCLETKDTSPLEPDVVEKKFYAPNVGFVLETDPETGERSELVRITTE